jgi:hypothetical protein
MAVLASTIVQVLSPGHQAEPGFFSLHSQKDIAHYLDYDKFLCGAGQLDAEIQAGCWCPIKTSLDLVLKPRIYQGLHIAKYHKVFWHQVSMLQHAYCEVWWKFVVELFVNALLHDMPMHASHNTKPVPAGLDDSWRTLLEYF